NSMALDGIDAEYISSKGMKTFNMAIAGSHVSNSLLLLENYLKYNTKPKMIIIGLSSCIGRGYLNPVAFENPEVTFFYKPSIKNNLINPPLLNFQWLAVDMFKILISKDHRNATSVSGQWRTKKTIPDNSVYTNPKTFTVDYSNQYLSKIIALCESNRIKVVITEMPGSNFHRNALPFQRPILFQKNTIKTVYNLNNYVVSSAIIDAQKDWLATDHLNSYGARKITDYLFNSVIKKEFSTQ
ncbi:hypothetical protein, partial [Flavobacterium sp.]|uniref:hypothetical protein n=1 Tax=Flavobacterium sp. TaxID=239 RepID=UPI0025D329FE